MILIAIFIKLHEYNKEERNHLSDNGNEIKDLFILSLIIKNGTKRKRYNKIAINTTNKSLEIVVKIKITIEQVIIDNNSTNIKLKSYIIVRNV